MSKRLTNEEYIARARSVHGDRYDYSHTHYTSAFAPITIICRVHGPFTQTPHSHEKGNGCVQCSGLSRKDASTFIADARKVHGEKCNYDKVVYVNNHAKVTITCPLHGDFYQTPNMHLRGRGCRACGYKKIASLYQSNREEFIAKANQVHAFKYTYDHVVYVESKTAVTITCPVHGDFNQLPNGHLMGEGCAKCGVTASKGEDEVAAFLTSIGNYTVLRRVRDVIPPQEIDIYIPELKLAVEYCGIYWHSNARKPNNYHVNKLVACEAAGVRLITLFEDEWLTKEAIVKSTLARIVHADSTAHIYARNTTIAVPSKLERDALLDAYHIQGKGHARISYGLYADHKLVSVMEFIKRQGDGVYELTRFCASVPVVGGFSKLLKHFQKTHEWKQIVTFADRRWSVGNVYMKNGFTRDVVLRPSYTYFISQTCRKHKFGFRHSKLKKILPNYDPTKSELKNTLANGYYRIYDCGMIRFVLNNTV